MLRPSPGSTWHRERVGTGGSQHPCSRRARRKENKRRLKESRRAPRTSQGEEKPRGPPSRAGAESQRPPLGVPAAALSARSPRRRAGQGSSTPQAPARLPAALAARGS